MKKSLKLLIAAGMVAGSTVALADGAALYKSACFACHDAGVAGAPKLGDKALWEPRIAAGVDTMVQTVITGKGAMPPKGGTTLSEDEIRQVVEFMVSQVK